MNQYTRLRAEIEAEYDAFCVNPGRDMQRFYELLFTYLKRMAWKFMNEVQYIDEVEIEDIANDVLEYVAKEGLHAFKKEKALFTTYCAQIVKHKVWNWKKKQIRLSLTADDEFEEYPDTRNQLSSCSPEYQIFACEKQLEMITLVKKYVQTLMDWKQKPYRTVGCGYTMILFQKYHPRTKELTSPKWAFEVLESKSVEQGAESFLSEIRQWMPEVSFCWNDDFLNAMDEIEEGQPVSDIIFGERFKAKDFENWSLRLRTKIKQQLLESEKSFE